MMAWLTPKLDWTADDYFNPEDLNRVENNTIEVTKLIKELLEAQVILDSPKTDRDYTSIEFAEGYNKVERNIERIKKYNLTGWENPKTDWEPGDPFGHKDILRMEKNLNLHYKMLKGNIEMIPYCGTFSCGEVMI